MTYLHVQDAEQRNEAAPVPAVQAVPADSGSPTALDSPRPEPDDVDAVPGGPRAAAVARALRCRVPQADLADTVQHLLAAADAADNDAGIARVDTTDATLQQQITRIVSGTSLPSRGPAARARDIVKLLLAGQHS